MEGRKEGVLTIKGGDFNAWTGNRRGMWSEIGEKSKRKREEDQRI